MEKQRWQARLSAKWRCFLLSFGGDATLALINTLLSGEDASGGDLGRDRGVSALGKRVG
jgi:hypothetical protein